jgi:hypothetical protein
MDKRLSITSVTSPRMPPRRKAEESVAALLCWAEGGLGGCAMTGAIGRGFRVLASDSLSTGTGAATAQRSSEGKAQRTNFFNGTKLPISLKTKGRDGRLGETNLPFAPLAGRRRSWFGASPKVRRNWGSWRRCARWDTVAGGLGAASARAVRETGCRSPSRL